MSAPSTGSLAGVRVLDLSRVLAGPLCSQMLADHGADVIKVEPPAGDDTRTLGPPFNASGDAAYFSALNRGKRCISIDLARPAGRELVWKLLDSTDVLIENFLPGTMEKWGLSQAAIAARHPRLVYCSISGFGADGPLGGLPGYDAVLQAMCGLMSTNGVASSGPTRIGVPIVDHLTAYTALSGILMALLKRASTGLGQRVEATLFDAALSLLVPHGANYFETGKDPRLLGSAHPNIAPYDKFRCGDGEIFLGIMNRPQFEKFCRAIARPDMLVDPRFANNASRVAHRDALRVEIETAVVDLDRTALCTGLMASGVPAGPVNSVSEAFAQPHALHRDMLVRREGYRGIGLPVRLDKTPGAAASDPPAFNAQALDILREAGYPPQEIDRLLADGVVSRTNLPVVQADAVD